MNSIFNLMNKLTIIKTNNIENKYSESNRLLAMYICHTLINIKNVTYVTIPIGTIFTIFFICSSMSHLNTGFEWGFMHVVIVIMTLISIIFFILIPDKKFFDKFLYYCYS